ncbi:hypothetical protein HK405_002248 [Cladochytrium tenue]|nr:hypothetical protein HK405_002248 [Cladochytrium tenue]
MPAAAAAAVASTTSLADSEINNFILSINNFVEYEQPTCGQACLEADITFPFTETSLTSLCAGDLTDVSYYCRDFKSYLSEISTATTTSTTSSTTTTKSSSTSAATSSTGSSSSPGMPALEIFSIIVGGLGILAGLYSGFKIARITSQLSQARSSGQLYAFYAEKTRLGISRLRMYFASIGLAVVSLIVSIALLARFGFTGPSQALSIVACGLTIGALAILHPGKFVKDAPSLPTATATADTTTGDSPSAQAGAAWSALGGGGAPPGATQEYVAPLVDSKLRSAAIKPVMAAYHVHQHAADLTPAGLEHGTHVVAGMHGSLNVPGGSIVSGVGSSSGSGGTVAAVGAGVGVGVSIGIGVVVGSCLGSSLVATAATVASVALSSASTANTAATSAGLFQSAYCLAGMTSSCCSALSSSALDQAFLDVDNTIDSQCWVSWTESENWSSYAANVEACDDSYNNNGDLSAYVKCIAAEFTSLGALASMCSLSAADINALDNVGSACSA